MSGTAPPTQPPAFYTIARGFRAAFALLLSTTICGCASSLPTQVYRPVTTAVEMPQSTPLGAMVQHLKPAGSRLQASSAFTLLSGAQAAYGARLSLVEGAERTLDLQYYAIHADESTQRLLRGVVEAARRGVRVRVLLDDFHSTGANAQVMRLAFVPGIEMRMFNPLAGARSSTLGRAYTLLTDFQRAQQRMHNKLFIADNAMGVIGGRNLGDAYFDADSASNFVDLDVLAAGPIVKDLSRSFDSYWNNPRAYPVQSLISLKELKQMRERFADDADQAQDDDPTPAVPAKEKADDQASEHRRIIWDQQPMDLRKAPWTWAPAAVLVDEPAKIPLDKDDGPSASADAPAPATPAPNGPQAKPAGTLPVSQPTPALRQVARPVLEAESVVDGLLALVRKTRRDLLVVSPYFVPGPDMMEAFRGARERGVRVRILTNSLASNDAPLAHAGYARHRKALLEMGVELYEMRSTAAGVRSAFGAGSTGSGGPSGATGASRAMLHSKLLVVDGHLVAVGSMNLDLRSQLQNTEIALLIASSEFGRLATQSIDDGLQDGSWRVEIDEDGDLVWRASEDSDRKDQHSEPDASWGLRLMLKLIGPLAPDHLL